MRHEFDRAELQNLFLEISERIPQLAWTAGDDGRWTWASARWIDYTGLSDQASQGYGWMDAIDPRDRAAMASGWRDAPERGVVDVRHRLLAADRSGKARWFNTKSRPVAGADGAGHVWLGISTDVDADRLPPQRSRAASLQDCERRIANVVALARFVSRQTASNSGNLEQCALQLDGRMEAIARLQTNLRSNARTGVDLAGIVADRLLAHAVHEGDQVHVAGPSVRLRGATADLIGLAMHELSTNAVEHGAFAVPLGGLAVSWDVESVAGGAALRIEWAESGSRVVAAPERRSGFGTELIERTLNRKLGATGSLAFAPDGVRCTISLPLTGDVLVSDEGGSGLLG